MNAGPSPRRLAADFGAVFLVTALGFVAGRASTAGRPPSPAPATAAPTPTPAATAPRTQEGTHSVDGIPLGYSDDKRGAVDAATTFCRVLGGPLVLSPTAFTAALQVIGAPNQVATLTAAAEQQLQQMDQSYQLITLASQGVPVSVTAVPLRYRIESFSPKQASIDVWTVGVFAAEGHTLPTATWTTVDYQLSWVASVSDWRLDRASLVDAAWAPAEVQPTPATSDVPGQLSQYQGYPDVPG